MTRWAPGTSAEVKRDIAALSSDRTRALACVDSNEHAVWCRRCGKELLKLQGVERMGMAPFPEQFGDLIVIACHEASCRRKRGDA